jgi:DNA-binding beta-propeller fold protein YncE
LILRWVCTFKNINMSYFKLIAIAFSIVSVMIFVGCKGDDIMPAPPPETLGQGFFVVNEGNFTVGNSSVSFYSYDSARMFNNMFYAANGAPLGDVASSMSFFRNSAFIVVNNSGLIYVVDKNSMAYMTKITGLQSPRQIHFINAEKAYISDLQSDSLIFFNPQSLDYMGAIGLGKSSEAMLSVNEKLFVANWSNYYQTAPNNTIMVIDWLSDQLVDSIVVAKEPNSMVIDKDNKLWVLCSGGYMNEETPALFCIDPITLEKLQVLYFEDITSSPQQLCINAGGDTLYFLSNGIYRLPIDNPELPQAPFIEMGLRNFYSLAVDPLLSHVLVTDAVNYLQDGYVFRYRPNGMLIDSIRAGIIPGQIRFN